MNLLTGFDGNMRLEGTEEQILNDVNPNATVGVYVFADFNRMILQMLIFFILQIIMLLFFIICFSLILY